MDYANPEALVSTAWLAEHLEAPDVRVVDGSWHMPQLKRDPRAEFESGHIPGAVFFDIDGIADDASPLPHMLPSAAVFAERVGALGLGDGTRIIAYDATGVGSAARVWWSFRVFGHDDVAVLDGGAAKWIAEGRALEADWPRPASRPFTPRARRTLVRDIDQLRANLDSAREQVLDARSRGRFAATEPEPRPGLRGGHIPGALNLPFLDLYDSAAKTLKPAAALTALYAAAGVREGVPVTTSCGSGITACNLALGLHLIGRDEVAVYDGSWTEWGGRDDLPVEP